MTPFRYCIAISFFLIGYITNAQQIPVSFRLKATDTIPLEKATILIRHLHSGKTARSGFTGPDGQFSTSLDTGRYTLMASYTGLENIQDTFYLQPGRQTAFSYALIQKATVMEGVVVTAQKKLVEARDDKFIYNVGDDSLARSKSVSQVLNNLPFVTVDGMGAVQVAGQSTFKVLLNGKETGLFVSNVAMALKSFPADIVARVELSLLPGAKYDAEGVTAIINIITKKKFQGYKVFAIAYMSDRSHFSDALTLTAKTGRWGITVNGSADGSFNPLNGYKTTTTTPLRPGSYQRRYVNGGEMIKNVTLGGTIELNYEIDSIRSIISYITAGRRSADNNLNQQVDMLLANNTNETGLIDAQSRDVTPNMTAGLDFTQKAKKNPSQEASIRFNWQGNNNRIRNNTAQQYGSFTKWMNNNSTARNDEFTLQADLIPYAQKGITVETGLKTILRRAVADYTSLFTYDNNAAYEKDPLNSNSFTYHQQVVAGYGSATIRKGKNTLRIGLRAEQTSIKGMFSNLSSPVKDQYFTIVPNLSFTRKIGAPSSLVASYNLNLLRPYITSLNPFVNNVDSFNISYGNPELGPQKVHATSLQYRYNNEKLFFTASMGYSWSNDKILPYSRFDESTGVMHRTFGNAGKERIISFRLGSSYHFSKTFWAGWFNDLRYVDIRNRLQPAQKNYGYAGLSSCNFNWKASERFSLSGSGGVMVYNVTLLGRSSPVTFYQVNFGYHIVKDRLFATMNWNNVDSRYFTQTTRFADDQVSTVISSKTIYRVIFVGIQYNFGRLKQEVTRKKGVQNDDLVK